MRTEFWGKSGAGECRFAVGMFEGPSLTTLLAFPRRLAKFLWSPLGIASVHSKLTQDFKLLT